MWVLFLTMIANYWLVIAVASIVAVLAGVFFAWVYLRKAKVS
ncbi:hypothetical protein BEH62_03465 [Clavibacter michiganensis subsp. insidiosus]|nr:hypothetical protein BEH62_03465 [Clavibacter michiganensis subsp. insidiosus]